APERLRCVRDAPADGAGSRVPVFLRSHVVLRTADDGSRPTMRILYLADIRFPLERANGIQSMETCYALAEIGHDVTLLVRPDTHDPARDPFAFYGLRPLDRLRIEVVPIAGAPASRRAGYLTFALGRAAGRSRHDLIVTRDLGLASLLLRLPSAVRAP